MSDDKTATNIVDVKQSAFLNLKGRSGIYIKKSDISSYSIRPDREHSKRYTICIFVLSCENPWIISYPISTINELAREINPEHEDYCEKEE